MAYIGKTPVIGNFQKCDSISVVNGQAAYTLQVGGSNVSPQSENHMLVSLNGILQAPTDSFTVSGSTITFASALSTGDVIDFVMILGNVLDLGVPSDNTVSLAKLTATGTKDSTTFLRGDNSFANAGITMADQWRISAAHSGSGYITSNWERIDTDNPGLIGSAMTQSSGEFTFPSTGTYLVSFVTSCDADSGNVTYIFSEIWMTPDNSTYSQTAAVADSAEAGYRGSSNVITLINVNNTSNVKVKFRVNGSAETFNANGNSTYTRTGVTFIRLGDST